MFGVFNKSAICGALFAANTSNYYLDNDEMEFLHHV